MSEIEKEESELANKQNEIQNQLTQISAQRIRLAGGYEELKKLVDAETAEIS